MFIINVNAAFLTPSISHLKVVMYLHVFLTFIAYYVITHWQH